MADAVFDFELLAAFNFHWECALCGKNDVAFGLAQAWRDAMNHRAACRG